MFKHKPPDIPVTIKRTDPFPPRMAEQIKPTITEEENRNEDSENPSNPEIHERG